MEYEFVGQKTGKVYARGNKSDCFRQLIKEFPTKTTKYDRSKRTPELIPIYPEPIIIRPVRKIVTLERG